jgi:hypothetical protein
MKNFIWEHSKVYSMGLFDFFKGKPKKLRRTECPLCFGSGRLPNFGLTAENFRHGAPPDYKPCSGCGGNGWRTYEVDDD